MTTWEHASSKLGKISDKAYKIAHEVWHAAAAAGVDIWFMWGDGSDPDHVYNKQGRPVLDFMVRTEWEGDWVRNYCWEHRKRHGLKHIIWEQHITSTVVSPGERRKMSNRGNPTANHMDHNHGEWFGGGYVGPDAPTTPVGDQLLAVDGGLGPKTISKWQRVMGTKVDGVITPGNSDLVRAVQRRLKATVNSRLEVDGDGIYQNGQYYKTAVALQQYLGTGVDGRISAPVSQVIKALQRRLNENRF